MTKEQFTSECKRRFGRSNPERLNIGTWEWMVRRGTNPYLARTELGLEGHYGDNNPDFAFERFGMTRTIMPDGRIICIAGEHEDSYDPDFCIYNDVIVLRPAPGRPTVTADTGTVEIYGFPEADFPPTDFHSATLIGDRIFIIGRLGYHGTRVPDQTPVLVLDTKTYGISNFPTKGRPPGWLYEHHASYDAEANAIVVRGGNIEVPGRNHETANHSAYRLRLADSTWELVAQNERRQRFVIQETGRTRNLREAAEQSFRPTDVPYDWLAPEEHGVTVYAVSIRHVRVTFEDFYTEIRVLVEGDLPDELVDRMLASVQQNLNRDTGGTWSIKK